MTQKYSLLLIIFQAEELRILREKTPKDLWNEDIETFLAELEVNISLQHR